MANFSHAPPKGVTNRLSKGILSDEQLEKVNNYVDGLKQLYPDAVERIDKNSFVINNCSSIVASTGEPVVLLSSEMVDKRNMLPSAGQFFAHATDPEAKSIANIKGRVVTISDSGFIGTDGTDYPGPGLIGQGDNLRFIKNVVRWLGCELRRFKTSIPNLNEFG